MNKGSDFLKCLKNCDYIKGKSPITKCYGCENFVDRPCKECVSWWNPNVDRLSRKLRKEKNVKNEH